MIYEILSGPFALGSFLIFFVGILARGILYLRGLDWQLDRVTYSVNRYHGMKGAAKSILYWLLPLGTRGWRNKFGFMFVAFVFHISILTTPLFIKGHNYLLMERWGFSFWSMPDFMADFLTLAAIVAALIILLRRLSFPEVRIITTPRNIVLLIIAAAPFVTGFIAHKQLGNYDFWLAAHILSGEIMLISIPFTKLSHFILFFFSRAQIGMDFGIKRGGMKKSKGMAW
ncbi:HMC operon ORF 5 protein [Candidatus Desulfarcum epimagneticum]|uniref:HMC operon ORF 5 protein n=1 Tax=uncultured Desulfobacteraceae bacterium TaxID=218296 RepID=A0A484HG97_9BACT|nr:HMC operon ORF 5 protein [uncultured Desulfobacteraceae bacterium]